MRIWICSRITVLLFLLVSVSLVQANIVLSVPDTAILPNAPGQSVLVYAINPGAPVSLIGLGLNIQVADGGLEAGGLIRGPWVTDVDIFSPNFLFGLNNNGQGGAGSILPQIYEAGTLTQSGFVQLPQGTVILGSITLDTTGFSAYGEAWNLALESLNGTSDLFGTDGNPISLILQAGRLTIVPEPSGYALAAAGLIILGCRHKWRQIRGKKVLRCF